MPFFVVTVMQSTNTTYPVRMFIRHKAHVKLVEALQAIQPDTPLDATLFWDVTNTLLQPSTSPDLYRPYANREQAVQVEERAADEIAASYLRIKQQAVDPLVQDLNKLL